MIAVNTQKLYKKALEFDNKMAELNSKYNFLDKKMDRFTEDQIPSIPNGLIDPGTH